jgi:signal peptidase II
MRLLLTLTLPLYVADQLTKWAVLATISVHEYVPVIPGVFNLVQVHNTGAAFGMFKDNNLFFIGLASVALVVLAVMARRGCFLDAPTRVGAALLASGILGNLTDRLIHGHWPAFNIADAAICTAAGLFLLSGFLEARPEKNQG